MNQYIELLKRFKKAAIFMDGLAANEEKDFYIPEFIKIIQELCSMTMQLNLTEKDILEIEKGLI